MNGTTQLVSSYSAYCKEYPQITKRQHRLGSTTSLMTNKLLIYLKFK